MNNSWSSHNPTDRREDREEIVIVTSKQYLAVADDFLCRFFPEITLGVLANSAFFTVFITDDVVH